MPESPEQTASQQLYWDQLSDIGPDSFDALAESAAPFPALSVIPENTAAFAGAGLMVGELDVALSSISRGSSAMWDELPDPGSEILGAIEEEFMEEEEVENLPATQPEVPIHIPPTVVTPRKYITSPITRTDSAATSITVTAPTPQFSRVAFPSRSPPGVDFNVGRNTSTSPSLRKRTASSLSPTETVSPSKRARVERNPFSVLASATNTSTTSRPAPAASVSPSSTAKDGYFVVAHSKRYQAAIDKRELAWGTQWEIGRLITKRQVSWDSLTFESLDRLRGTNSDAASRVSRLLRKTSAPEPEGGAPAPQLVVPDELRARYYAVEMAKMDPFGELDVEEALLVKDDPRRLGITSLQSDHYFGGRVVQTISIGPSVKEPNWSEKKVRDALLRLPLRERFEAVMEPQEQGRSTRFSRWYGSRRIIAVQIHKLLLKSDGRDLVEFFSLGFVIFGRVFRAFMAKEKGVYLVETDENYERCPSASPIDAGRLSFMDFIGSHNPLAQNSGQAMAKWAARFQIAMSTSVPWVKFDRAHIYDEPDIISPKWNLAKGKPPAEYTMTDGCGFMNGTAARLLASRFDLPFAPCVVQARLGGAKGMFLVKPGEDGADDPPKAWCRPSQLKVTWPDHPNDSQLMFDVVRLPRVAFPSKASAETLMNLAHNGVPHSVFKDLMRTGLEEEVRALTTWDTGDSASSAALWLAVCKAGGIIGERMRRETASTARARGYGEDAALDNDNDGDDEDAMGQARSARWWPDEISGCPSTLHETVCSLLTAGFMPSTNPVLFSKLDAVMRTAVMAYVKRYKIGIPSSLSAFIIPDPLNVLKEGELFFRCSRPILNPATGKELDVLEGDVLVSRHPTKLPTDVQKLRAVDVPELRMYKDIVILSVQGEKSSASYLSGGDYDGDTVSVIWEPSIVGPFVNAPPHLADPPDDLDKEFSRENESVPKFISRVGDKTTPEIVREVQRVLLGTLIDNSVVGQYSNWHELAIYKYGLDHPETRRLAHLFCNQLDGAKSGLRIRHDVRKRDAAAWTAYTDLDWKVNDIDMQGPTVDTSGENKLVIKRPKTLGRFIMDDLKSAGRIEAQMHFARYKERGAQEWPDDQDLISPYKDAETRAQLLMDKNKISLMQEELDVLVKEVSDVHAEHKKALLGKGAYVTPQKKKPSGFGRSTSFTDLSIQTRQDTMRRLSALFACSKYEYRFFSSDEVRRIKASYAYKLAPKQRFPFDVAFRDLCEIKAKALGPHSTVTQDFYNRMAVHKGVLQLLRAPE